MAYKTGKKARKAALLLVVNLFFILLCFLVLIPVLYAFSVSLNADNSLLSSDFSFLPKHMTLANYRAVFVEETYFKMVFQQYMDGAGRGYRFPWGRESRQPMCFPGKNFREGKLFCGF